MARATSSYKFEQSGDEVIFSVVAAEKRIPIIRRILFSIVCFFAFMGIFGTSNVVFISSIVGAIAVFIIAGKLVVWSDKKYRGQGGNFKASPRGIIFNNEESVSVERIHRLILRNTFSDVVIPYAVGGMVGGGSGIAGATMATGAAIGNALAGGLAQAAIADKNRNMAIGYRLDVEYAGNAKTLASGMTETTAYGLMQDVGRVLRLSGS